MIALGAIWANKLRSFLTVLGNIVAVTSIIAVVSLVQGMNGYVTDGDRLGRRRRQFHDSADARRAHRKPTRNASAAIPRITLDEAAAVRKFSENVGAVAAQAQSRRAMHVRQRERSTARRSRASRATTCTFGTFNAEAGPADQPGRNRRHCARSRSSDGKSPTSCSGRPIRSTRSSRSAACTSGSSASARRRDRSSAIRRTSSRSSRSASSARCSARGCSSLQLLVKPKTPDLVKVAMDDATVAMRIERRLRPNEPDNFGMFTSDTFLDIYKHGHQRASSPCSSASSRCRSSSAASSS